MASGNQQTYVLERQNLLERLLDAVKQCQVRFGGKSELAPDSDSRVVCLCQQLEAVLRYGLKKSRRLPAPAILTKVASSQKQDSQQAFWVCVKEHLSKSELERFSNLEHITTDVGRGRAWLRASLNEHTLERYLQELLADTSILNIHYESHAYLLDIERASTLPQMAAGLSSILFALTVDNPDLNGPAKVLSNSSSLATSNKAQQSVPEAVVAPEAKEMMTVKKRKKKRKSKHGEFVDSEVGEAENATIYSTSSIPIPTGSQSVSPFTTPSMSTQNTPSGDENAENLMKSKLSNQNNRQDIEPTIVEVVSGFQTTESQGDSPLLYSMTESGDVQIDPHASLNSWKPSSENDVSRTRGVVIQTFGMPSETKAAVQALQAAHRAQESLERSKYSSVSQSPPSSSMDKTEHPTLTTQSSPLPSPVVNQHSLSPDSMTNAELKQAIISVIQRKDEVEAKNSELANGYEDLTLKVESLEKELLAVREEASRANEESQSKVQALSRENELLKHQLKRYVGVVQTMRRERSTSLTKETAEALSVVPTIQPATEPLRFRAESINEADHYEKKLVQVTEMHGELMEFNENLHIQLLRKELEVKRLRCQLARYSGVSVQDEGPRTDTLEGRQETRPTSPGGLVNVWIPTAFLNGRGADSHHVYQVFIRIRDDEWNVYRRYTQFRELYKQACMYLPAVRKFDFPPKKTLGSRDINFVEMRRQQLQEFLRFLFDVILRGGDNIDGTALDIKARPSKKGLMKAIPFFAENSTQRPTGPPVGGHQYSGL